MTEPSRPPQHPLLRRAMSLRVLQWWFTVDSDDEDIRRRATSYLILCLGCALLSPPFFLGALTQPSPGREVWMISIAFSIPTYLLGAALARRGHVDLAGMQIPVVFTANVLAVSIVQQEILPLFNLLFCPLLASFAVRPFLVPVVSALCVASLVPFRLAYGELGAEEPYVGVIAFLLIACGSAIWVSSLITRWYYQELLLTSKELERARASAEVASEAKSQFLANISHEMRTPLNAIIGYSELISEEAHDMDIDTFDADLDRVHGASLQLLSLIDDVLDLTKIESGHMALHAEDIELSELLEELAQTTSSLIARNRNRLEIDIEAAVPTLYTDHTKLRQILLNLLSNAAKFTDEGTITLSAAMHDEDTIVLVVRDDGIGIDAEAQAQIFKAFVQADASTTRRYGGTGLGLALSQQFADLLGGHIELDSALGQGSTFRLFLPAHHPELSPTPAAATT